MIVLRYVWEEAMPTAFQQYQQFAHAERKNIDFDAMGCPRRFRKKIIGLAWRHFYKFGQKYAYHPQPSYRVQCKTKYTNIEGTKKIILRTLDNWLYAAFSLSCPLYILHDQENDIVFASFWNNEDFVKLVHCKHGQEFGFSFQNTQYVCHVEHVPQTFSTKDWEEMLIRAKQSTFQKHKEAYKLEESDLFKFYCILYCIEKMIQLLREQNNTPKRAHESCEKIKYELMQVAWHPDYFFDWCLDVEEQKEIKSRWSSRVSNLKR